MKVYPSSSSSKTWVVSILGGRCLNSKHPILCHRFPDHTCHSVVQLLRGQAAIQVMCAAADAVAEIGLIPARGISMYQ